MAPSDPSSLDGFLQGWQLLLSLWCPSGALGQVAQDVRNKESLTHAPPSAKPQPVKVRHQRSQDRPALLEQLELSVPLSTYQADRLVSVGNHLGELRLGFSHFTQAMGLCPSATSITVDTRDAIWSLPASHKIARHIQTECQHDIASLAWGGEQRWASPRPLPSTEVGVGNGLRNLRCCFEYGSLRVGVIRALARLSSSLEKVPGWFLPPPAASG